MGLGVCRDVVQVSPFCCFGVRYFQMYVLLACGFGALHFLLGEGIMIFQFEAFVFFFIKFSVVRI